VTPRRVPPANSISQRQARASTGAADLRREGHRRLAWLRRASPTSPRALPAVSTCAACRSSRCSQALCSGCRTHRRSSSGQKGGSDGTAAPTTRRSRPSPARWPRARRARRHHLRQARARGDDLLGLDPLAQRRRRRDHRPRLRLEPPDAHLHHRDVREHPDHRGGHEHPELPVQGELRGHRLGVHRHEHEHPDRLLGRALRVPRRLSSLNFVAIVTGNATANSLDGLRFVGNRIASLGTTRRPPRSSSLRPTIASRSRTTSATGRRSTTRPAWSRLARTARPTSTSAATC
jgi:hypothetical protein